MIPEGELTLDEWEKFHEIEGQLFGIIRDVRVERRSLLSFDDGSVSVICADAHNGQDRWDSRNDPNHNRLLGFADLDALLEVNGLLRASNPSSEVYCRLGSEVAADDLVAHVVLLGGVAWNRVTRRYQDALRQMPIQQFEDPAYAAGAIFGAFNETGDAMNFYPEWDVNEDGEKVLIEDVAFVARLPNPFHRNRTLTLFNGTHSRGIYGAVRCFTDRRVRDANELYLSDRFPDGRFALLLRVPIVANQTLSPDLQNPTGRLFEWPPQE